MIASKILGALVVAAVCSSALCAGIYRAETKGHELTEQSGFASPVQVGARKSAEQAAPKIEQQQTKSAERLEQVRQEPAATQLKEEYPQLEQSALKQEEYREESVKSAAPAPVAAAPAPAPAAAPLAPIKGAERKTESKLTSPAKTQQTQVRFEQTEQRREEPQQREEQKEFKQEKIESFEQKNYQQQEYDSEPAYVQAASRYEEQQPIAQQQYSEEQTRVESSSSYQAPAEAKGRKLPPKQPAELRQEEELASASLQQQQQPAGEPEPYQFSYQVDGSSRSEQGDTKGVVRGQYTLRGADGASRVVDYVADHEGFRATVNTNEFGTESKSPANVQLRTSQPLAEEISIRTDSTRAASLRPLRLEATKGAARYEAPAKGYYQQEQVKEVKYEAPKETRYEAPAKGYYQQEQVKEVKYEAPKETRYEAPAKGYYQQEQVKEVKYEAPKETRYEAPAKGYYQQEQVKEVKYEAPKETRYEAPAKGYYQQEQVKEVKYEAPKETRYEAPAKGYSQPQEPAKEIRYEAPAKGYSQPQEPAKEVRYEAPAKGYLPQQAEQVKETRYEAPAKGYLAQQQSELPKEAQWSTKSHSAQSAEYRAPEPQHQEPLRATEDLLEQPQQHQLPRYNKQPQASRSFESATAHQYERKLSPAAARNRVATRPAVL